MNFYYFMADRMADRSLTLYHELAAHEHFCPVCIFVTVEQFSCHHAAEFFYLVHIAIDRLLEHLIDHFKIP